TAMFENFIASTYASGIEFVTLGDLAERISAFEKSQLTWSRLGDTVTATVSSSDAGRFALDLDDLGTNKIANVVGWYAYDGDSVFLPRDGGTYTIHLGAAADDGTRITSLPMRSELVALTGDGTNLSFQLVGEGRVVVDLADPSGHRLAVSGADVVSVTGDTLTLALRGNGAHDVGISLHRVSSGNTAIDFNANGSADILWRHSDGSLALWEISGANASAHVLDVVPSSWSLIEAHGDYNGDGKSDLVWRHSDGSVATWEMSGGNATGRLFGVVPTSWSLIDGHGDYNGDGKSDLLWRNSDGTVATWEMNGAQFTGHVLGIVPLGWSVIDSHGDYNGDGKNDLLWRHTDGTVATWHMNGADMTGQLFGLVPESWRLLDGHGDYNGDGKSDLLWRDSDGTVALWQMDGATFSGHVLGVVPGNWSLIDGHGDYNGDAISDLLWRHEDGTVAIWQMNGAVFSGHVLAVVPSSWSLIEGHSDYNGDGRSDVLWRDSDGTVAVWQMDGAQFASHILPVVPSGWQVSDATEMGATLNGDDADNILSGTVGRDTLRGGLGNDTLTGGAGSDRYVYGNIGEGGDTIYGFTPGSEGDVLDVREILVGYTPGSSNLADFVRLTESGGNTIVSIDADGTGGDFVALTTLQAVTGLLVADLHAQGNLLVA
ncbi:MAG: type I secretion C-terminal target domain-containing protein, partial [Burkholderiales bacterium]